MRKSGRVGNDFVASAYRKEHWRARAETSILSYRCVGETLPLGYSLYQEVTREGRWLAYGPHRNQEQGSFSSEEGERCQGGLYGRTDSYSITRIVGDVGGLARVVSWSGRNEGGDDCNSSVYLPWTPHHLQLAVYTLSQGFLAGGTEQPRTGVGGIWLSQRWVMAGEGQEGH